MKNHLKKLACLLVIISTVFVLSVSAYAFTDAQYLMADQVVNQSITNDAKEDYYKFTLTSYQKALISISTTMRPYTLTVYDANQKQVWAKTVSRGLFETVTNETVVHETDGFEAGTYFLKVSSTRTGNYQFKLHFKNATKAPAPDVDADLNNSLESAKLALLETTSTGKILKDNEEDYFKFVIPSSGTVELDMLSKMRYYSAALLNEKGDELWSTMGNEWDSAKKQRKDTYKFELSKGTYFLKVNAYRSAFKIAKATGSYQFELYFTSAGVNETEPNNTIVEARKIALDSLVKGHLSLSDGTDFYEISVAKGEVAIGFVSYMSSYNITIYDEYAKEKWSSKGNAKEEKAKTRSDLHKVTLDAGKYYIKVDAAQGKYTFKVSQDTVVGKVTKIKYTRTPTTIRLTWNAAANAQGYEVYKYDETKKEYVKVGSTTKRYLKIKKLKQGTTYKFKIKAYKKLNGVEIYGDLSKVRSATTNPARVTIKSLKPGSKSATISWGAVNGADGYRIYYSTDRDFESYKKVTVKGADSLKKTIKKLKKGKKYYFKVRAYKVVDGKKVFSTYYSKLKSVRVK